MKRLIQDIHRRSLWAVLAVYIVLSFLILQIIQAFGTRLTLPSWLFTAALVLLSIGLPIILATAFVQGVSTPDAGQDESSRAVPARDAAAIRRVFSWRNALVGGLGGFAALAIGTAAWVFGGVGTGLTDVRGIAPVAAARDVSAEEAAAEAFRALGRAIEAMNVEATLAAYDEVPDFSYVFGSELIEGRAAFDRRVRASFAALRDIESWEVEGLETTRIDDRHILVTARFREVAVDTAGRRLNLAGVHTNLFVRRDGVWLIARGHTSAEPVGPDP